MNLRVDLILETEQRSASPVSLTFVIRLLAITLLSVLVLVSIFYFKRMQETASETRGLNNNISAIRFKYDAHLALKSKLTVQGGVLAECKSWEKGHIEWFAALAAIARLVPPTIQLRDVKIERINSTVNKKPVRLVTLYIKGRAVGENAAPDVDKLRQDILKTPEFVTAVKEVVIPAGSFKMDSDPRASKADRVFELVCRYAPMNYE